MKPTIPSRYSYPPVNSDDRAWGLVVTSAGDVTIAPGAPYPPPGHPSGYQFDWERGRVLAEFAVVMISEGSGKFESSHVSREIEGGDLFLLLPGEWHRYRPHTETGWREHWVCFQGPHVEYLFETKILDARNPVYACADDRIISPLFLRLLKMVLEEGTGFQPIASSLTLEILARAQAHHRIGRHGSREEELVSRTRGILNEHMSGHLKMEDVAAELGVGYSWLRKTFKQHTGLAMNQYHLQARINRAKRLLRDTMLTIKDISDTLGFESQFHFSRLFKKKVEVSPREFRTAARNHYNQ